MEDPTSAPEVEDATLPAGTKLGKYEVVRLLGQGGMGAVYEGIHMEMGKRVAIKTLSPAVSEIPGARQRFVREAQLTSRVRHPHIVDVSDVGQDSGRAFIVMELLRGEDLSQRLARTGAMGPRELVDVLLPVCSALVAAHEATIVHRDLKPQNIFLATGPHGVVPKVLDFGISKSADALSAGGGLTRTGSVMGTPYYLAPEQIQDARQAGSSSDQYALGVILYECLAGERPFGGESLFQVFNAIVNERPAPLASRRPGLPAGLAEIVERAMSAQAAARFPSVRALGRALLPYASPKTQAIWDEAFAAGPDEPAAAALPVPASVTRPTTPIAPTPTPAPSRTPAPVFVATTPYGMRAAASTPPPAGDLRASVPPTADLGPAVDLRPSRKPLFVGLVAAAAIGAVVAFALRAGDAPAPVPPPHEEPQAKAAPVAPPPPPEPKVAAPAPAVPPPAAAPAPAAAEVPPPAPVAAEAPPALVAAPPASPKEAPAKHRRPSVSKRRAAAPTSAPPAPTPAPEAPAPRRSFNPNGAPVID